MVRSLIVLIMLFAFTPTADSAPVCKDGTCTIKAPEHGRLVVRVRSWRRSRCS